MGYMCLFQFWFPRRIAGSYGAIIPSFLRTLHTIFQSGCINLQTHQQCKSIPFSLHPDQHLLFVDFFFFFFFCHAIHLFKVCNLKCVIRWFLVYSQGCTTVTTNSITPYYFKKKPPPMEDRPHPPALGNHDSGNWSHTAVMQPFGFFDEAAYFPSSPT